MLSYLDLPIDSVTILERLTLPSALEAGESTLSALWGGFTRPKSSWPPKPIFNQIPQTLPRGGKPPHNPYRGEIFFPGKKGGALGGF